MSAWINIPASTSLLAEIDEVGMPTRLKAQDGTIGDTAHAAGGTSDHLPDEDFPALAGKDSDKINEVHARDVDSRGPWRPGWSMERIVQLIVARCRAGQEKRIRYLIYRGRIWVWRNGQFVQQIYTGSDQHNEHAHFSFEYGSGSGRGNVENQAGPWGISAAFRMEDFMAGLDDAKQADMYWRIQRIHTMVRGIERSMNGLGAGLTTLPEFPDAETGYTFPARPMAPNAKLDSLAAAVNGLDDMTDEDRASIVAGILAGMPSDLAKRVAQETLDQINSRMQS